MGRYLPLVLLLLSAPPLTAQTYRELQVHGVGTFANSDFVGGGAGFGYRPRGRIGFALNLSAGDYRAGLAGRGEALVVLRLDPRRARGVSPYGLVGLAAVMDRTSTDGYLVVGLGLESAPARRASWFLEGGVGGGARVMAGMRFRHVRR